MSVADDASLCYEGWPSQLHLCLPSVVFAASCCLALCSSLCRRLVRHTPAARLCGTSPRVSRLAADGDTSPEEPADRILNFLQDQSSMSCRQAEEAWKLWKSGAYGDVGLEQGIIEYAKSHDELNEAFFTYQYDAEQIYPGWSEQLSPGDDPTDSSSSS